MSVESLNEVVQPPICKLKYLSRANDKDRNVQDKKLQAASVILM